VPSAPELVDAARAAGDDISRCLDLARGVGRTLPLPGSGRTAKRWQALAACAAGDLTAARVLEPHADALGILAEAGEADGDPGCSDSTWGVFAAEAPGARLEFRDGALHGTKPWCSLGDRLSHALVTAHAGEQRGLFAVALRSPGVRADPPERWVSRGLARVTSVAMHFDGVAARPVGEPGWYLRRPGFAWGGIGVAACWYGGAVALAAPLRVRVRERGNDIDALHLGVVDLALHSAREALAAAARRVDDATVTDPATTDPATTDPAALALRVRSTVAAAAETVLRRVAHALGPAPLAFDERHARRVADLEIYLRQHHGERDVAALGAAVTEERDADLLDLGAEGDR